MTSHTGSYTQQDPAAGSACWVKASVFSPAFVCFPAEWESGSFIHYLFEKTHSEKICLLVLCLGEGFLVIYFYDSAVQNLHREAFRRERGAEERAGGTERATAKYRWVSVHCSCKTFEDRHKMNKLRLIASLSPKSPSSFEAGVQTPTDEG